MRRSKPFIDDDTVEPLGAPLDDPPGGIKQWKSVRFAKASTDKEELEALTREMLAKKMPGITEEEIEHAIKESQSATTWLGGFEDETGRHSFQVAVYPPELNNKTDVWPEMVHLSIKRTDREPIHDWRELQAVKNAIVGPDHDAVELYPAESRRVDGANQYHLWVLADASVSFPFGFFERLVDYDDPVGGGKQRRETV